MKKRVIITDVPKYQKGNYVLPETEVVAKRDTIYPAIGNEMLFQRHSILGKQPYAIVREVKKGKKRELSGWEKALKLIDDTMSAPSRGMVYLATGEYKDPSKAWGYKNPDNVWKKLANAGIDLVADPVNLVPGMAALKALGTAGDAAKVASKVDDIADVGKTTRPMSSTNVFKFDPKDFHKYIPKENINKYKKLYDENTIKTFSELDYGKLKNIKSTIEKTGKSSGKMDEDLVRVLPLVNDLIDIHENITGYDTYTPLFADNNRRAISTTNAPKNTGQGMAMKSTLKSLKQKPVAASKINAAVQTAQQTDQPVLLDKVKTPEKKVIYRYIDSEGEIMNSASPLKTFPDRNIKTKIERTDMDKYTPKGAGWEIVVPENMKRVPRAQLGGEPHIVPQEQLTPIQTEVGEYVIHPNFDVTKVAAKLPHSRLGNKITDTLTPQQTDEMGNIVSPGAYVVSRDKRMKIPFKLAEGLELGVEPAFYSEDIQLPQANVIKASDLLFKNKKDATPAKLVKNVLSKYPNAIRDKNTDIFAAKATAMNKESRVLPLAIIKELNTMMRNVDNIANPQPPQGPEMAPEQEQMPMDPAMMDPTTMEQPPMMRYGGKRKYQLGGGMTMPYSVLETLRNALKKAGITLDGGNDPFAPGRGDQVTKPPIAPIQSGNALSHIKVEAPSINGDPNLGIKADKADHILPIRSPGFSVNVPSFGDNNMADVEEYYKKLLADMDADKIYETDMTQVRTVPMAYQLAQGVAGLTGVAAQNPISDIYSDNPALVHEAFKKINPGVIQSMYDIAQASQNQMATMAALNAGVTPAMITSMFSDNAGNLAKAKALTDVYANNLSLDRNKATRQMTNEERTIMQKNANIADRNRKISQLGNISAQTLAALGNIYAQSYMYKQTQSANKMRDKMNLINSLQGLKIFKDLSKK